MGGKDKDGPADKFFSEKTAVRAQTGGAGLRWSFASGKAPCREKGKFF
jgi:hypothetical protein